MNNIFSFRRFGMLMGKHTAEYYRTYLMSFGVLAGLMAIIGGFIFYVSNGGVGPKFQFAIFVFPYLLSGLIFTSMVFADYGDRKRSVSVMTLPASNLEKYLVAWLYSFVIFQLMFLIAFYAIDYSLLVFYQDQNKGKIELLNFFSFGYGFWRIFFAYAFLHSISFFGAVFFNKNHFIKTMLAVFAIGFLFMLLNKPIANLVFGFEVVKAPPFSEAIIFENKLEYKVAVGKSAQIAVDYVLLAVILAMWTAAYFKLKEKEV
ncbi:MAG TPA: hypothetical protein VKB19_02100 [Pedobacter sp.]|nr:hypothetical protein [Pedobacter sp.]